MQVFSYTLPPPKTVGTELPGVHRASLLQPGLRVQMSTPKVGMHAQLCSVQGPLSCSPFPNCLGILANRTSCCP